MTQPTLRPDGTPVNLNSNGATDIESRWDFKLEAVLSGRVLRKSVLQFANKRSEPRFPLL